MFAANITLSSRSQPEVLNPTVSVKKNGIQTRKPNWEPVLTTRTAAPTATRGRRRMIETLPARVASGRSPCGASGERPVGSRTSSRASSPPSVTSPRAHHRVWYEPIAGIVALATREPRVGRPPVKANQYQPTAVPIRRGSVAAVTHTRNP